MTKSPEERLFEHGAKIRIVSPAAEGEHHATDNPPSGHDTDSNAQPPNPLETFTIASLAGVPVPVREFIDERRLIPCRNVTMLMGDGGTGKSLLILQLGLSMTLDQSWIGIAVKSGAMLYLSAEDDKNEVHIRAHEICAGEGWDFARVKNLHMTCLAGEDAILAHENRKGLLYPTQLFARLDATLALIRPAVLALDNLADVFGGNEISRTQAKQFIGLLRQRAIRFDCAVILIGHPSLVGISTGTGASGSTGWSNSARSRLYLHKDAGKDGVEVDQSVRILETMKANYGPRGQAIGLQWIDGRFVRRDKAKPFDDVSLADLERAQEAFRQGQYAVSELAMDWGGYVVASILDLDVGRGIGKEERTAEQNRARANVKHVLATWVRNKALFVVQGRNAKRERQSFYSTKEANYGLL